MKRTLSGLIALLAYLGPPTGAFFVMQADHREQLAGHGWICGNSMIGIICLAGIASSVLSLVATGFGIASFCALSKPRPRARGVELVFLLLPFLIAGSYVTLLLFA